MSDDEAAARKPVDVVLQAELRASPPERVWAWLEKRAADARSLRWVDTEAIEHSLLERGDALITLALARFGADSDVLKELWDRQAKGDKALRLAVLMNEVTGSRGFGVPSILVDGDLGEFMGQLDYEEVGALFSNHTLGSAFLSGFFEQKVAWQGMDEAHRQAAISQLASNPRMQASYEGPMDGWAEHQHNQVYDAAWELAAKVPVTLEWATRLCWLYENLAPRAYSVLAPLELAARWAPLQADAERIAEELEEIERGDLGPYARMRKGIARLAVRSCHEAEEREALATHADPGVRAAYYFEADMTLARPIHECGHCAL